MGKTTNLTTLSFWSCSINDCLMYSKIVLCAITQSTWHQMDGGYWTLAMKICVIEHCEPWHDVSSCCLVWRTAYYTVDTWAVWPRGAFWRVSGEYPSCWTSVYTVYIARPCRCLRVSFYAVLGSVCVRKSCRSDCTQTCRCHLDTAPPQSHCLTPRVVYCHRDRSRNHWWTPM